MNLTWENPPCSHKDRWLLDAMVQNIAVKVQVTTNQRLTAVNKQLLSHNIYTKHRNFRLDINYLLGILPSL